MTRLSLAKYRFHCRALTPIVLPRYAGSTWRGAFGHALRRTVCVTGKPECGDCLLRRNCAYSYLFETPPPDEARMLRKYPAAPHPFMIHPEASHGARYQEGDAFTVDLSLIGRGNAQLPYVVHGWQVMGGQGVGQGRGQFNLETVSQQDQDGSWQGIYRHGTGRLNPLSAASVAEMPKPGGLWSLIFETPVRIQHQEHLMGPDAFQFRGFLAALLRRLSLLCYFHGETVMEIDFRGLLEQAETIRPKATTLHWYDWERYSNRQKTRMRMGGLLGKVVFEGSDLSPFWPWLVAGQRFHVGKGAVMGLGGYRLAPATASQPSQSREAPEEAT